MTKQEQLEKKALDAKAAYAAYRDAEDAYHQAMYELEECIQEKDNE